MRDNDGNVFREIDSFKILLSSSSDIEEKEYTGIRGIANITLSTDFKCTCIEPDACNSPPVSSESIGTRLA